MTDAAQRDQTQLDQWWSELTAAALIGTARRPVPAPPRWLVPTRAEASPEVTLLDAAAVGSALRRAGAVPSRVEDDERPRCADPDQLPLAPARARQLLDLLLTQSPVGARLAPQAVVVWLRQAARHGVRVHHATLVPLLTAATDTRALRDVVPPVLDRRGAWLAAANPAWHWAVPDAPSSQPTTGEQGSADWRHLPTDQRAVQVRSVRRTDPQRGRSLVESTWDTDPATARADLLATLEVGLSLDDELLLERALDDRSAAVRDVAYRLLDGLPGSARAGRLADLLTPLLSTTGFVRRKVHVELPSAPAPAAVRDGLGKAPKGRSERGLWLQRLAAGAPFDTWTRATGLTPDAVVRTLDDEDALLGLRAAAIARRDATWARALLDRGWDDRLARRLPPEELADGMLGRVGQVTTVAELVSTLRLAPGPWPEDVSAKVVARLTRIDRAPHHLPELVTVLAAGLHPAAAPAVQRLADTGGGGPTDPLHQLAQYLWLVPTITEAFT